MAWSRLSAEDSKGWTTANPGGTRHWFRRRVVRDRAKIGAVVENYSMDDNPGLSEAAKARIKAGLRGHAYRRLVLGEWCDAAGMIFPHWTLVDRAPQTGAPHWRVGVSWSSAGAVGAVLGVLDGPDRQDKRRGVVVAERRHDPETEDLIPDAQQGEETAAWITRVTGLEDRDLRFRARVLGASRTPPAFRDAIRDAGYRFATADDGDLHGGIQSTSAALASGAWRISRACGELRDELPSYIWDPEAAKRGEDKPLRAPAPLCNALRNMLHAPAGATVVEDAAGF